MRRWHTDAGASRRGSSSSPFVSLPHRLGSLAVALRHGSSPYTSHCPLGSLVLRGCAELALALPVGGLAPAIPFLLSPASFPGNCRCQITARWAGSWGWSAPSWWLGNESLSCLRPALLRLPSGCRLGCKRPAPARPSIGSAVGNSTRPGQPFPSGTAPGCANLVLPGLAARMTWLSPSIHSK